MSWMLVDGYVFFIIKIYLGKKNGIVDLDLFYCMNDMWYFVNYLLL